LDIVGCGTPKAAAAFACVSPFPSMYHSISTANVTRACSAAASALEKPKSEKTF
jgi:hypothetical protein